MSTGGIYIPTDPPAADAPVLSRFGTYLKQLDANGFTDTARSVLEADVRYIVEKCVVSPGTGTWRGGRRRTGMVVGSVQSGKTASILGLVALLLDRAEGEGVPVVVVLLGGTKLDLWMQSYSRFARDLEPRVQVHPQFKPTREDGCAVELGRLKHSLRHGQSSVVITQKTETLATVRIRIDKALSKARPSAPVHVVVIDDEADDGSVLRAGDESLANHIARLCSMGGDQCYSTYVGYTATPYANRLQEQQNPLTPRHFVFALRTPGRGTPPTEDGPRSLVFGEPEGVLRYYTGSQVFYIENRGLWLDGTNSLPESLVQIRERPARLRGEEGADYRERVKQHVLTMLPEALRCYLVAGAARLLCSGRRLSGLDGPFETREELRAKLPPTHTMMVHTSHEKAEHFELRNQLVECLSTLWEELQNRGNDGAWSAQFAAFRKSAARLSSCGATRSVVACRA